MYLQVQDTSAEDGIILFRNFGSCLPK